MYFTWLMNGILPAICNAFSVRRNIWLVIGKKKLLNIC